MLNKQLYCLNFSQTPTVMKYLCTCLVALCSFATTAFAQPTFTITPSTTAAVDPGENITFDVTVSGFTEIISTQFAVRWNPSVLSFVSLDEPNGTDFPGLSAANFGAEMGSTSMGTFNMSWLENSLTPVSVDDGTRIFSFTLMSVGGGTTAVEIDPDATQEVIDGNFEDVGLMATNTSIEVTGDAVATCSDGIQNQGEEGIDCGGPCEACDTCMDGVQNGDETGVDCGGSCDPCPTCTDGVQNGDETGVDCGGSCDPCDTMGNDEFTLTVENRTVSPDDEFCLNVTVDNFTDLGSFQFSMSWDIAELEFTMVQNTTSDLADFSEANFGLTETDNGRLRVSWNPIDPTPEYTLPSGTVLFQICFRALGMNGTNTGVQFANLPLGIEVVDANDNFLDVDTNDSQVAIQGDVDPPADCPQDASPFCISNVTGAVGTTVCVPISAQNFDNILSFQHSMAFNSAALQFSSIVIPGNLAGLAESQFSTDDANSGIISVAWFDSNIEGITLDNGTELYQLCFDVQTAGTHLLSFSENPVPYEIINGDEQEVTFNSADGSITGTTETDVCAGVATTSIMGTVTDVDCRGESTGSIDISVTGGGEGYGFEWSNSTMDEDLSGLVAGTYMVTVTSNCSDPQMMSFTIGEPADGIDVMVNVTNGVNCFGEMTGTIDVEASGGTGNLGFLWNGEGTQNGVADQVGLAAGDYMLTVSDEDGCTVAQTVTVDGPTMALSADPVVQDAGCGGMMTGSIDLNITGGTGGYTVMWSDGETGVMRTGLAMGDYTPESVTDANGCTLAIGTQTVGGGGAAIMISSEINTVTPDMNGSIDVTVSGGTEPYTYAWTGPNDYTENTEDISNLDLPGAYILTVTDANGCAQMATISLAQPLELAFDISNACDGADNGSITILTSGGVLPYEFAWTDSENNEVGDGTATLSGVGVGTYIIVVTDDAMTTLTDTFTIETSPAFMVTDTVTNETASGINDNGAISLDVTGGVGELSYLWSDESLPNAPMVSGLDSGEYTVIISDQNGCTTTQTYTVNYIPSTPSPGNYVANDASCDGIEDGSLSFSITNGDPNYVVVLNGGSLTNDTTMLDDYNPTFIRENLTAGRYDISITDGNGLDTMVTVTITAPDAFTSVGTIGSNTDAVECNGNIGLTISGGAGDETFLWSNGDATSTVTGLCADEYMVTITDANGCTKIDTFDLTLFTAEAVTNPTLCPEGEFTGNIDLTVNGGVAPFTYAWQDEEGNTLDDTEDLSDLEAGVYTVTVTEASGTSIMEDITVMSTSRLAVNVMNEQNINGFGVSCNGATDAELVAMGINSDQFAYQWLDEEMNEIAGATTADLSGVGAGTYFVEVTNDRNCTVTGMIEVVEPTALTVMEDVLNIACNGDGDGEVMLTVDGGVRFMDNEYEYDWSHTEDNNFPTAIGLLAGDYIVTITDANDCILVDTIMVEQPDSLIVLTEITPFSVNAPGSITTQVSGGTMPYRYEWVDVKSTDLVAITSELDNLTSEQTFCLIVTDINGCTTKIASLPVFNLTDCLETPPVLTPNGDGINELFEIQCLLQYPENSLEVYSRWGQLVYQQTGYDNSWTGRDVDGNPLPDGAYYFVFAYTDQNGTPLQETGSLSILNEQ